MKKLRENLILWMSTNIQVWSPVFPSPIYTYKVKITGKDVGNIIHKI
jgi:hypothetical protein